MESDAVAARYDRFARVEAPGRSAQYAEWAAGIAADPATCELLATIPAERRQPPLVFAVTRLLGAHEGGYAAWRAWLHAHAAAVVAECGRRSLQTNEPLRCAALLPALGTIAGPVALLEVGASAGLCLYPDRYSYRYALPDGGMLSLDPPDGASRVVLESALRGPGRPALGMPEVVWRAGIDLHPLDPADPDTEAWLTRLVWPGESGRSERISAALRIAAADPPRLVAGDAVDALAELAASAPADATLVITTPGVLVHIPRAGRERLIAEAPALGEWITLDPPALHDAWHPPIGPTWPADAFVLARGGRVLAAADPLGRFVEWHPGG